MAMRRSLDQWNESDPWAMAAGTATPTDPQAQVDPTPNPWTDQSGAAPAVAGAPAAPSYTSVMGPTPQQPGVEAPPDWSSPTPSAPAASAAPAAADYQPLMAALSTATDPQQQAVARDELARRVQTDLEADGHKVAWKGEQLVVDGRPYELGGAATSQGFVVDRDQDQAPDPATVAPVSTAGPAGTAPHAPAERNLESDFQQATTGLVANERDQVSLNELAARLRAQGYTTALPETDPQGRNQGLIIDGQLYRVIDSGNRWTLVSNAGNTAWGADTPASAITASPFANGGGELPPWLQNPEADPDLMRLADSIPGWEDIYKQLSADTPEEQATSALLQKILANPESLDPRTVEMLKAKNAEEIAAGARAQDEDLQHFGFAGNLDMSPWLAGQRAQTAWNARSGIVGSNRAVDMEAAATNQKDRAMAVNLGQGWAQYRQGKSAQAINLAFESVGAKGDLEKAAKSLGMSKAQLAISYIGQNLNYDISLQALVQRGEQFAQELAQRIAEMKQRSDEFEAQFGLDLDRHQLDKDRFAWDRAQSTFK